jgi:amidophosphoribosyltransferase
MSVDKIRRFVGADSLGYLSIEGLLRAVSKPSNYCTACWSSRYPVPFGGEADKFSLEKFAGQGRC